MDEADRSKDRRASASQSGANAMHWMRMSLDRQMRACKSSRSSRAPGAWAEVLARLSSPARKHPFPSLSKTAVRSGLGGGPGRTRTYDETVVALTIEVRT